jgi:RNA binding exosome subunit
LASPIQSVEVTFLIHATEEEKRVTALIKRALFLETPAEVIKMQGHFGNTIKRVTFRLTKHDATVFFERLVVMLPAQEKTALLQQLPLLTDEHGALYLRLDKQELVAGRLKSRERDSVRIRAKTRAFPTKDSATFIFRRLLERGGYGNQAKRQKVSAR